MKKKELQSIDYIKERADENLAKTKSVFLYRRELAIRFALRQKVFGAFNQSAFSTFNISLNKRRLFFTLSTKVSKVTSST